MCFASTVCAGDLGLCMRWLKYTDSRHSARSVLRSALSESAQRKVTACSLSGGLSSLPSPAASRPACDVGRDELGNTAQFTTDTELTAVPASQLCRECASQDGGDDTRKAPRGAQREQLKAEKERLLYAVQRRGRSLRSTARRAQRHPPRPPGGLQPAVASSTGATRSRMSPGAPHQTSPPTLEVSSSCARATPCPRGPASEPPCGTGSSCGTNSEIGAILNHTSSVSIPQA